MQADLWLISRRQRGGDGKRGGKAVTFSIQSSATTGAHREGDDGKAEAPESQRSGES